MKNGNSSKEKQALYKFKFLVNLWDNIVILLNEFFYYASFQGDSPFSTSAM